MGGLFAKIGGPLMIAAIALLGAGLLFFAAVHTINGMVDQARLSAIAERDSYWKGQIAESNAEAEAKRAAQAEVAMKLQAAASDRVRAAEDKQAKVEKDNAALTDDGTCGLKRDRIRLLNQQ